MTMTGLVRICNPFNLDIFEESAQVADINTLAEDDLQSFLLVVWSLSVAKCLPPCYPNKEEDQTIFHLDGINPILLVCQPCFDMC
jgi:hypothetical protein